MDVIVDICRVMDVVVDVSSIMHHLGDIGGIVNKYHRGICKEIGHNSSVRVYCHCSRIVGVPVIPMVKTVSVIC